MARKPLIRLLSFVAATALGASALANNGQPTPFMPNKPGFPYPVHCNVPSALPNERCLPNFGKCWEGSEICMQFCATDSNNITLYSCQSPSVTGW